MNSKFKSRRWLTLDYNPIKLEQEVRNFWEKNRISQRLMQLREKDNLGVLGYVEGPPTLNGVPHVGHARGRAIKDLRYRMKAMQGFYMTFWAGWDTQGLPVELEAEKELGVKNKRDIIEKIGEERFVEVCKNTLVKYHREWINADKKLGLFMNYDKAYWTHEDEYIEREWQYLKKAWQQGLLGEDYYVVAYCPNCQTSLSNAEVGLGYKEVEDPSLYFKIKLTESEDEYFLVWTTMPFTIITDMMLAVHPKAEYVKLEVKKERWIMAKERVNPVMQELETRKYRILETLLGSELEGLRYEYPFKDVVPRQRELEKLPEVHTVVCEEFVDVSTATGVVHLSPGNGEDDFLAAKKRHLPIYVPFDDECVFTSEAGSFAGLFARDADGKVVDELQKRGLLLSFKIISHEYPTCWRSHHKLIWLARREYFLWTNRINDKVIEAAEKTEYFYKGPRNRFLSFLKEGKPWCISRERVWGAPLPIWVCEECGTKVLVSSKKELLEKAIKTSNLQNFELHKPWIDRVILKCVECKGEMRREPFVLDCWHNSGASPYARFTDDEFGKYIPADFLVEAVDQTRGWANSLLLQHIILTGQPETPYKSFLFYNFVLDDKERKMSKSLGNIIEVNQLLQRFSADVCRLYLLWKCSPVETMNFDVNELVKRPYQILSTFYHLHRFFMQNAEYDNFDPKRHTLKLYIEKKSLKPPDHWILSKIQKTIKEVTKKLEACEFHTALSNLEFIIVDIISRQYVPMIRKELWSDEPSTKDRRLAVYATIFYILRALVLLLNPVIPYICEAMHQMTYRELDCTLHESVNFESWPKPDEIFFNDELETKFDVLLKCISLLYSVRQTAKLKRRWPLQKTIVVAPKHVHKALQSLEDMFLELGNIKEIEYAGEMPKIGSYSQDKWALISEDDVHILLFTERSDSLLGEGLMRDLARRVQALRKDLGFKPTDWLDAVHIAELSSNEVRLLKPHLTELLELVRVRAVHIHDKRAEMKIDWHKRSLDEKRVYISLS